MNVGPLGRCAQDRSDVHVIERPNGSIFFLWASCMVEDVDGEFRREFVELEIPEKIFPICR